MITITWLSMIRDSLAEPWGIIAEHHLVENAGPACNVALHCGKILHMHHLVSGRLLPNILWFCYLRAQ